MRKRIGMLALVSAVTACGGGSAAVQADGPVTMGVIAGNFQVVPAARDAALPQPVVAQVVRGPNGQVSLRILDALLPEKAYAQTTVTGIPGQVVCFNAPDPKHAMRAEVACASSDALGKATFVLHTDSVAGVSRGQVAAALATGTKVTDSVSATVMAGPVDPNFRVPAGIVVNLPAVVAADAVRDVYGNAVAFRIVSDGLIGVQDTTTGSVGARTIVSGPPPTTPVAQPTSGMVELRGMNGALVGHGRYTFDGARTQLRGFSSSGVNSAP
jgi:hypothetical protein